MGVDQPLRGSLGPGGAHVPKVWQLAALVTPASMTTRFTAFCTTLESRWCGPWVPDSISRQRFCWRNTLCQAHSRSAFGSLRARAYGISHLMGVLDRLRLGLRAQEGGEEGGGFSGVAQDSREPPGRIGGVAVMVEVGMTLRDAGKAG